ncbi:MAG: hypothetical protein M1830_000451 [Pleopsidium flavum]|nr:MAG: hypothetical protein M1830_000451 [Pleopsidium flavum]
MFREKTQEALSDTPAPGGILSPSLPHTVPKILLSISPSAPQYHISGTCPFYLQLSATLLAPSPPVTILTHNTIFGTLQNINGNGFNFVDTASGMKADRSHTDLCYMAPGPTMELKWENEKYFATMEPGIPYNVRHEFRRLPEPTGLQDNDTDLTAKIMRTGIPDSDTGGLEVGKTYRVELLQGDVGGRVGWWSYGRKEDVLKKGPKWSWKSAEMTHQLQPDGPVLVEVVGSCVFEVLP